MALTSVVPDDDDDEGGEGAFTGLIDKELGHARPCLHDTPPLLDPPNILCKLPEREGPERKKVDSLDNNVVGDEDEEESTGEAMTLATTECH